MQRPAFQGSANTLGFRVGGACFLMATLGAAILNGQDLRRPPAPADIDAIFAEGFPAARDRLATRLTDAYRPGAMGVSGSSGNAAFTSWFMLWRWCDLLARGHEQEIEALVGRHFFLKADEKKLIFVGPGREGGSELQGLPADDWEDVAKSESVREMLLKRVLPAGFALQSGTLASSLQPEFLAALMRDAAFSLAFFDALSPSDFTPSVLANLQAIRSAHPERWKEYQSLAIALAVVYDSRPPEFWPHPQVKADLVPREQQTVAEQFAGWVDANESRSTLLDPRKLTPEHLKFVVDAPVDPSEMEWARKNVRLTIPTFDRAFFQVPYSHDRLRKQNYTWNEDPYLLQTIRSRGGICVDQAYFAMLSGKAKGLPTLFFTGQGADGGHAWFGYMKSDDRWELNSGRYENQNYATGKALDPQNWKPISDHELKLLAASFRNKPEFRASVYDIAIGSLLEKSGDAAGAAKAYESATRTCPLNPDAWVARGEFLKRSGATAGVRKAFHEAALKQFTGTGNSDIRVFHQQALATLLREGGDSAAADRLDRLVLMQNRRKRSDISVSVAARRIGALIDALKLDEAGKEFFQQLKTLGDTGGGDFFYDVVVPYVTALVDAGKKPDARLAIQAAQKKLSPEPGGILALAFDDLEELSK